jgi:hypothetical protein
LVSAETWGSLWALIPKLILKARIRGDEAVLKKLKLLVAPSPYDKPKGRCGK